MMDKFMDGKMLSRRTLLSVFGGGIGYSFRYYLSGLVADDKVKMLEVDGIFPNKENIRDGSYPISGYFYAASRKDNQNENVRRLVEWLTSEEGQRMIEASGYVRLPENNESP